MLAGLLGLAGCITHVAEQDEPPPPAPEPELQAERVPDPMPETGYTWQHLVNYATAASPDYAALLAEARAEYFRYKAKTDLEDLRISFDYDYRDSSSNERTWDNFGMWRTQRSSSLRNQYGADLRFYVPNPFVNRHLLRAGKAAQRETEAEADVLKREIAFLVYELFQEVLVEEQTLTVLRAREQIQTDWKAHLKAQHAAHVAIQADVLALDLQRLRLKAAIQESRLAAQAARRSLQVLTRIPDGQLKLDTTPPDWPAVLVSLADEPALFSSAFERSAEMALAQAAYEKARAVLDSVKASQIPWFDYIEAGYATRGSDGSSVRSDGQFSSSQGDAEEWRAGLGINLPVFAWMSSEKKRAIAEMEAAALRHESTSRRIHTEITGYLVDLRETLEILTDYRATLAEIPEPARGATPDGETFYKLSDARLAAAEHAVKTEWNCAIIYGQLLNALGEM